MKFHAKFAGEFKLQNKMKFEETHIKRYNRRYIASIPSDKKKAQCMCGISRFGRHLVNDEHVVLLLERLSVETCVNEGLRIWHPGNVVLSTLQDEYSMLMIEYTNFHINNPTNSMVLHVLLFPLVPWSRFSVLFGNHEESTVTNFDRPVRSYS